MNTQNIIFKNISYKPLRHNNSLITYDQKLYDYNGNENGTITYKSVQMYIEKKELNDDVINWLKHRKIDISINFNMDEFLDTCVIQLFERKEDVEDLYHELVIKHDKEKVNGNKNNGYTMKLLKPNLYAYNLTFSLSIPLNGHVFSPCSYINFKFFDNKKNLKLNILSKQFKIFSSYAKIRRNHESLSNDESSKIKKSKKQKNTHKSNSLNHMMPTFDDLYEKLNILKGVTIQKNFENTFQQGSTSNEQEVKIISYNELTHSEKNIIKEE